MSLRRVVTKYLAGLRAPIHYDITGALCLTCGRPVDTEEIVDGLPGRNPYCRVLVTHHGQEELRTFEFDTIYWDDHDLARQMKSARFFDPRLAGECGFGAVAGSVKVS